MKQLLLPFLILICITVYTQPNCNHLPLITVTETATVKAKPDIATLDVEINKSFIIKEIHKVSESFLFSNEDMDIHMIDDNDLSHSLTQLLVNNDSAVFIKHFIIDVYNLNDLQRLYFELLRRGFTNIKGVELKVRNIETLKETAQEQAIKNATEKARRYAKLIAQPLGAVYRIKEKGYTLSNWFNDQEKSKLPEILNAEYLTNPGLITLSLTLEVSFDLSKD